MTSPFSPLAFAPLPGSTLATDDRAEARGHAAGYAAGRQVAERELITLRAQLEASAAIELAAARGRLDSAAAALTAAAGRIAALQAPVLADADRALAASALELATVLLGREPAPSSVETLERAIGMSSDLAPRRIRLNPADADAVSDLVPGGVEVLADPAILPGDAVLDLAHGELDARMTAALDRVRAALDGGPA